jgi:hypothetical protein
VRTLAELVRTGKWKWMSVGPPELKQRRDVRAHDQYANAITTDFLSPDPSASTLRLSQKFLVLLEKWKREVEASHRTFTVLVLPWKIEDAVATKLFRNFDENVIHSIGCSKIVKHVYFKMMTIGMSIETQR